MKTWTLRRQITLWSAMFTGLAVTIFGAVVAYNLYAEQVEVIDGEMATAARAIFERGSGSELRLEETDWLVARPHDESAIFGYITGPSSAVKPAHAFPEKLGRLVTAWPPARKRFTRSLDGARLRFGVFESRGTLLVLARSLDPAVESVLDLGQAYLIALPLVLLFVAGGSWWIARRALRPIVNITRMAKSITANRLGERLPAPKTEDEIGRHILVLNGMFDRLQGNFEQATRFSADAAHELRTPLTIMRGQIEDALRSGRPGPEQERLLVDLLEETTGLQKISDNLLLLARFDAGKNELQRETIDVSKLLEEAGEDAELLAAPRGIRITSQIAPAVCVDGDRVMLRRMALNLIDNAVKFNRTGGEVRLALNVEGSVTGFTVGNTGPGIPPERRDSLFERFYRADPGRDRPSGGSGLGLSLCREIVTAHGGGIELSSAEDDWTEFRVRLPRLIGKP
jgi:heavy metal sensor kinase